LERGTSTFPTQKRERKGGKSRRRSDRKQQKRREKRIRKGPCPPESGKGVFLGGREGNFYFRSKGRVPGCGGPSKVNLTITQGRRHAQKGRKASQGQKSARRRRGQTQTKKREDRDYVGPREKRVLANYDVRREGERETKEAIKVLWKLGRPPQKRKWRRTCARVTVPPETDGLHYSRAQRRGCSGTQNISKQSRKNLYHKWGVWTLTGA